MKRWFWGTLSVPLFLLASVLAAQPEATPDLLKLTEERGQEEIKVWAENTDPNATRWVSLELASEDNVRSVPALPLGLTLLPLQRVLAVTLSPRLISQGFSYTLSSRRGEGNPTKDPDPNAVYLLPWAHGVKHTLTQGYFGKITHQGVYALDFDLAEGSEVRAARAGIVYHVKDTSHIGGLSPEMMKWGNSIDVIHPDGTWATYAHLQHNGARVQEGEAVQAGQLLGYSGSTGMANGPHLHFSVYKATYHDPETIPTVFQVGVSQVASLEEGKTYYAYHPGGVSFTALLASDIKDEDLRGVTRTASGGKVSFREEKMDNRVFVYCDNGTGMAIDMKASFAQSEGVRTSVGLPYRAYVPAYTEVYMFAVDLIGPGKSGYQLSAQYRPSRR